MKPQLHDMSLKHDSRVIRLEVFINTAEPEAEILQRVQKAARGQLRNAAAVVAFVYTGAEGKKVWDSIQKLSRDVAANPRTVAVDEDGQPL